MVIQVAAVIDDDVGATYFLHDTLQKLLVVLASLIRADSLLAMGALVADVDANDLPTTEIPFPCAERLASFFGIVVSADADFEQRDRLVAEMPEVPVVVLGVPVCIPLVGAEMRGELDER